MEIVVTSHVLRDDPSISMKNSMREWVTRGRGFKGWNSGISRFSLVNLSLYSPPSKIFHSWRPEVSNLTSWSSLAYYLVVSWAFYLLIEIWMEEGGGTESSSPLTLDPLRQHTVWRKEEIHPFDSCISFSSKIIRHNSSLRWKIEILFAFTVVQPDGRCWLIIHVDQLIDLRRWV